MPISKARIMKEITITEFRTKCSAILSPVQRTKKPIRITRLGKPIAEIIPVDPLTNRDWMGSWMGSMKGKTKILGDIVSPACDEGDWEVLR
jgi:prevent-host-death family protein